MTCAITTALPRGDRARTSRVRPTRKLTRIHRPLSNGDVRENSAVARQMAYPAHPIRRDGGFCGAGQAQFQNRRDLAWDARELLLDGMEHVVRSGLALDEDGIDLEVAGAIDQRAVGKAGQDDHGQ